MGYTRTMSARRLLLLTVAIILFLAGCTRSRSTPEPTAPVEPAVVVEAGSGGEDSSGEPLVTINTPAALATLAETPSPESTPTRSTINYTVEAGDTLSSVAVKFGVEMETVRQLNRLFDDALYVGQILQMPYSEGITAEGLPTATPEPYRYVVVEGDTLGTIAENFGVNTVAIMEVNEMSDPNSLFVGQALIIPGQTAPVAAAPQADTVIGSEIAGATATPASVVHIVQPGDTLYGIAEVYNVEAPAIMSVNNIANGNQLRVGQQLRIPGISARDAAAARGRVHIIQSGENLTTIANLYGVTAEEVIQFNGISNPDTIYVGQQLIIPGQ